MQKENGPVMLEDYVKIRRRQVRKRRILCAGILLLAAICLRLLMPQSAETVRAWVFGDGQLNDAVSAFYACAEGGAPVSDAVEAFCIALEQN